MLSSCARHFFLCLVLVNPEKPVRTWLNIVDWDVKNQNKQNKIGWVLISFLCLINAHE